MQDLINTIICGDCLDVMRDWPDDCVDLVVTSPPYNIGKGYATHKDKMKWGDFMAWQLGVRRELFRISSDVVYIIGSHNNFEFLSRLRQQPLGEQRTIILPTWSIVNPVEVAVYEFNGRERWSKKHRLPIVCNGAISTYLPCIVGSAAGDMLYGDHPCTFPERFPEAFITSLSDENDLIFDPFSGTGTTCAVSSRLKRNYIGIDISPEYCAIARKRIEAADKGITVKELDKGQRVLF